MDERCYSMLGVRKSSLALSAFTFVLCRMCDGREQLYIIPSRVLLNAMRDSKAFKRFYIPHQPKDRWRIVFLGNLDWSLYEDAWHLLSQESVASSASTRTG